MRDKSTPAGGGQGEQYAALVKIGDAVTTPDDEVWVVTGFVTFDALELIAASRGDDGLVFVDPYEQTKTTLPRELVAKVADARRVRRS
jgi:hypothetical protein